MPVVKADTELNLITVYYPIASNDISGTISLKHSTVYKVQWYNPADGKWTNSADISVATDGNAYLPVKPVLTKDYMLLLQKKH